MDIVLQLQKIFQLIVLTPRRRQTYTFVFLTISIACVKHAPWECMLLRICVPSALDILHASCIIFYIFQFLLRDRLVFAYDETTPQYGEPSRNLIDNKNSESIWVIQLQQISISFCQRSLNCVALNSPQGHAHAPKTYYSHNS